MECCKIYTIPKKCVVSGNTFTTKYFYNRPDGEPIPLNETTITLEFISSMGDVVKTKSIQAPEAKDNFIIVTAETDGLSGRYIQRLSVLFEDGKKIVDMGEVIIYGIG